MVERRRRDVHVQIGNLLVRAQAKAAVIGKVRRFVHGDQDNPWRCHSQPSSHASTRQVGCLWPQARDLPRRGRTARRAEKKKKKKQSGCLAPPPPSQATRAPRPERGFGLAPARQRRRRNIRDSISRMSRQNLSSTVVLSEQRTTWPTPKTMTGAVPKSATSGSGFGRRVEGRNSVVVEA